MNRPKPIPSYSGRRFLSSCVRRRRTNGSPIRPIRCAGKPRPSHPDQLVEVVIEDGRVWIHYAEYFERPLRLTPDQALALVTAGSGLLAVPGADPDGPLARGLAKLAETLGVTPGADIDIDRSCFCKNQDSTED